MQVDSDRRYRFDREPQQVFDVMASVGDYPSWWPWLEQFDGEALKAGDRWRCTVRAPVPYRVGFVVALDEVTEPWVVRATISGDIEGTARLDIGPGPDGGSTVRLRARLAPAHAGLRLLGRFARPLIRYGHDWVLDTGARQFRAHVARRAAAAPGTDR